MAEQHRLSPPCPVLHPTSPWGGINTVTLGLVSLGHSMPQMQLCIRIFLGLWSGHRNGTHVLDTFIVKASQSDRLTPGFGGVLERVI